MRVIGYYVSRLEKIYCSNKETQNAWRKEEDAEDNT